jgi:hypothetical protein
MIRLQATLEAYLEQIAADLWHHYNGLDVRDLWRPGGGRSRLTYRLLGVLLRQLPGQSAYKTAVRDAVSDEDLAAYAKQPRTGHGPWSHHELISVAQVDVLRMILHVLVLAHGGKSKPPEPWPRPGVVTKRRKALSPEGLAHLRRLREEHAQLHKYDPVTGAPLSAIEPDRGDEAV